MCGKVHWKESPETNQLLMTLPESSSPPKSFSVSGPSLLEEEHGNTTTKVLLTIETSKKSLLAVLPKLTCQPALLHIHKGCQISAKHPSHHVLNDK